MVPKMLAPDVAGVTGQREASPAAGVLLVVVRVLVVAEARLDDDVVAVDLAVLGVGDDDLVLHVVTELEEATVLRQDQLDASGPCCRP